VLGYLITGIVIGLVVGLVGSETQEIQHFAVFGVVMMLFLVAWSWSRGRSGRCGWSWGRLPRSCSEVTLLLRPLFRFIADSRLREMADRRRQPQDTSPPRCRRLTISAEPQPRGRASQ
jgi:hypothetical protein